MQTYEKQTLLFTEAQLLLTGGDPCQPHSIAGNRKGKADNRYLWPEKFRVVREVRPDWIVNENVFGTVSNGVLDQKVSDLVSIGYACWPPLVIPAGAGEAPHIRDRVWLVAHSMRQGLPERIQTRQRSIQKETGTFQGGESSRTLAADTRPQLSIESAIYGPNDGLPRKLDGITFSEWRKETIQAYGNAIDPRIAHQIFQAIQNFPP